METENSRNLFILGAGFTKAALPDAPLNNELVSAIIKTNPEPLEKYRDRYRCDDIEIILTRIDIEEGSNPSDELLLDRRRIEQQIANYFTRYRFEPEDSPQWVSRFARDVLRKNDSVVSLNYDCYLEGALDHFHVWTPNGGYPEPINHPLAEGIRPNPKNIRIFKIHGSENFRDPPMIGDPHTFIGFVINGAIYPVSGLNRHFNVGGIDARPYIIAPSFVKTPHVSIEYIMLAALDRAQAVENLVIIGCGMRPEDSFLWLLLTRFLYGVPKDILKKLIILSPSSEGISYKIRDHCAPGIDKIAAIMPISMKMEDGIDELMKALNLN